MNSKERDIIAFFLAYIEYDGAIIEWVVDDLSDSDHKFRNIFEQWQKTIGDKAEYVAEYRRRMTDEFGVHWALLDDAKTEKRSAEIIEEIRALYAAEAELPPRRLRVDKKGILK